MKKILLPVMLFAFVTNVSAQLKVDVAGRVGIGTATPQYKLDIIGDTRVAGHIYLESDTNLIATTNDVPITFKVNGVSAGNTGALNKLNVSFGYNALSSSSTMSSANTAIGHGALRSSTMGSVNTAIGLAALSSNKTGGANVGIGIYSGTADSLINAIAIGWSAYATSSNQVRMGNSSMTSIGGYVEWTNLSDMRANKNIRTDVPGLAFINRLQPVTYNLDLDAIDGLLKIDKTKRPGEEEWLPELTEINRKAKEAKEKVVQTGFIAQDVEEIAKSIGYDFSGVDVDEIGIYGLRYAEFVVPLVKAVQELSAQNERLQAQVNELTKLVKERK
jgi:hypothetical protein